MSALTGTSDEKEENSCQGSEHPQRLENTLVVHVVEQCWLQENNVFFFSFPALKLFVVRISQ